MFLMAMSSNNSEIKREALSEAKRKLLATLARGEMATTARDLPIARRHSPHEPAPLAPAQEHLWLFEGNTPEHPPLYNESFTVRMTGPLNVEVLQRCLTEIVRRHEIWRTQYAATDGRWVQVINEPASSFSLGTVDLRRFPQADREAEALRLAVDQTRQPFDFQRGPLLRATLVQVGDTEYQLRMTGHQSIIDGVSVFQVFPSELARLYEAFSAGDISPLPELPIQFADFATWQRQLLQGEVFRRQLDYWQKRLGGKLPNLAWPNDRPRPSYQTFRGTVQPFAWSEEVSNSLQALRHRQQVTLFAVLLAGYVALLHRYTDQDDIIVGTFAPAGRKRSETQGLLGYFLNPVALRFNLSPRTTFHDLLKQAQTSIAETISHDDIPFEEVARTLQVQPDPSRNPFFTVGVSLQPPQPAIKYEWTVTSMDADNGGSRWDLYVAFIERRDGLIGRAQYNPDLFQVLTIRRMLDDWQQLLAAAAVQPQQMLSALPLASPVAEGNQADQLRGDNGGVTPSGCPHARR